MKPFGIHCCVWLQEEWSMNVHYLLTDEYIYAVEGKAVVFDDRSSQKDHFAARHVVFSWFPQALKV